MRNSDHSKALKHYEITAQGMIMRDALVDDSRTGNGTATAHAAGGRPNYPGLTEQETVVLQALIELQAASALALAWRIGLPEGLILTAALDRLVSLLYATTRDEPTGAICWPVAQTR